MEQQPQIIVNQHKLLAKDTIISFDVETTGFTAGVHSAISLGAVAYRGGKEISHYYGAMLEWKGAERDEETMKFWANNRPIWESLRKESVDAGTVMQGFFDWAIDLPKPRILAANPCAFDSSFLFWYLHKFVGKDASRDLFKKNFALDIRSYISAIFAVPYSEAYRSILPPEWSENQEITHNALDDAREQGTMLMNLMKASVGEIELL